MFLQAILIKGSNFFKNVDWLVTSHDFTILFCCMLPGLWNRNFIYYTIPQLMSYGYILTTACLNQALLFFKGTLSSLEIEFSSWAYEIYQTMLSVGLLIRFYCFYFMVLEIFKDLQ
jgi:hypothetical protein